MATNVLSLPVDVPWRLLATSDDMYATSILASLPAKWQSSLAVFYYEVPPDEGGTDNPDEITTFLKIVATITGFQPDLDELPSDMERWPSQVFTTTQKLEDLARYYPALSALVQVAVYPHEGEWPTLQYPYFSDFEPKKREVVETVSDTGEALSSSTNSLNVRKGTTSTDTTEALNVDRGASFSESVNIMGFGGSTEGSWQRDLGARSTIGTNSEKVVTADASRERRETLSHTTNLSQLYSVLGSYHSGTNRAVFLLNARPHLVQEAYTFVNGPRELEGIQEFFLVVRRPKTMSGICVKAILETAHISDGTYTVTNPEPPRATRTVSATLAGSAKGGAWVLAVQKDKVVETTIQFGDGWEVATTPAATAIQIENEKGKHKLTVDVPAGVTLVVRRLKTDDDYEFDAVPQFSFGSDNLNVKSLLTGFYDPLGNSEDGNAHLDATVSVELVSTDKIDPTTTTVQDTTLFMTGRVVAGCTIGPPPKLGSLPIFISFEKPMKHASSLLNQAKTGVGPNAMRAANALSREIQTEVMSSFRKAHRYPTQTVDFYHSAFALRALSDTFRGSARGRSVAHREQALDPLVARNLAARAPGLTTHELAQMSPEELAKVANVPASDARRALGTLFGLGSTKR